MGGYYKRWMACGQQWISRILADFFATPLRTKEATEGRQIYTRRRLRLPSSPLKGYAGQVAEASGGRKMSNIEFSMSNVKVKKKQQRTEDG